MVEQFNVYLATKYSKTLSFSGCRSPSTGTSQLLLSSICLPHQTSADRNWPCPWAKPGMVIPPITGVLTSTGTILRLISHLWGIFLGSYWFFFCFLLDWRKRTSSEDLLRPMWRSKSTMSTAEGPNPTGHQPLCALQPAWSVGVGPAAPPPPSLVLIKNHNYSRI